MDCPVLVFKEWLTIGLQKPSHSNFVLRTLCPQNARGIEKMLIYYKCPVGDKTACEEGFLSTAVHSKYPSRSD